MVDVLSDFDLPDVAAAAPQRASTTTPLQALTLLNHRFTLDLAAAFAGRLTGPDPIGQAYGLALPRPPSPAEPAGAERRAAEHGLALKHN